MTFELSYAIGGLAVAIFALTIVIMVNSGKKSKSSKR